jgi:hypothetical protein
VACGAAGKLLFRPDMSQKQLQYPFVPKSTASLIPGQFWALPLSDGSFGCGRVIQLKPREMTGARTTFLAAVLDWHSAELPTPESIALAPCLDQGSVHLKAVTETGGVILGFRDLDDDGIQPWIFRGADGWKNSHVQQGFIDIRPQQPEDCSLPLYSAWGFKFAACIAEARFVKSTGPYAAKRVQPIPANPRVAET